MLETLVDFLASQTWESAAANFWWLLFIELPRYTLSAFVVVWALLRAHREEAAHAAAAPGVLAVSAVVPGHNDAASLRKTVMSLREQVGVDLQIIVVNDGSTDDTDATGRALERAGWADHYVRLRSRGGKAAAVNAALGLARHPFFLVTDSDTTFDRDAVRNACRYLADPRVGAVGGTLRVRNAEASLATRFQQVNYLISIGLGRSVKDMLGFYFVASGAFGLYRTEIVRSLGGWEVGPGEDGDVATRIRLAGYRMRFAPRAVAMTDVPATFERLARQRLRWDRSMVRLRWRKSRRAVLDPFRSTWDPMFTLSFIDIWIFQGLLPFVFLAYLGQLLWLYGAFAIVIALAIQVLYVALSHVKFVLALAVTTRPREDLALLPYVAGYSLANVYLLRLTKMFATLNELVLRRSYDDAYVPEKVRDRAIRY